MSKINALKLSVGVHTAVLSSDGFGNSSLNTTHNTSVLHLFSKGCIIISKNITLQKEALIFQSQPMFFDALQQIDGFSVDIKSPGLSPAIQGLTLLGSDSNGTTWTRVGSSRFRRLPAGIRFLDDDAVDPERLASLMRVLLCR